MKQWLSAIIFCSLLQTGCSDYKLSVIVEDLPPPVLAPEIEVTPEEHEFGALSASGDTASLIINISNIGTDTLTIENIYLSNNDPAFSIVGIGSTSLEPLESTDLIIAYDPLTYEVNFDIVNIISNDEDEPNSSVEVGGSGDAPVITISPDLHDFGSVYLGCDDTLEVEVGNVGNVDLTISDIEYFATLPADFGLEPYEDAYGLLPITISPGGFMFLDISYIPLDIYDDSAYVEITSDDPIAPIVSSDHEGLGDYGGYVSDNFTQDGNAIVDILFVIDNSGSMGSNQANFINNFDSFINVFSGAGVDYQLAFITTDNEAFVDGAIVTPASPDPVVEVGTIVGNIGTTGSAMEKGLYYSYLATQPGADAGLGGGFLRPAAKLVVIYVSDEPDGSGSLVSTSEVSSHLASLKSSSSMVNAHAVSGDYPSGCSGNGGAQFGDGYYDVVSDLGGTFMSICAADWGAQMDTLARDSIALMNFPLSRSPIESTIEVRVSGVITSDWTYDQSANSIILDIAPADGESIDISYAVWAECV